MNKFIKVAIIVLSMTSLSSCAVHSGLVSNQNNNTTEVVLTKNNYKIIERVQGESEARYVLGFGGLKKNGLIAKAKSNMLENADIIGSSKAVINETVELKQSFFPFVTKVKVIVSAYIVEFTE
ncbi:DUF6567 family protein [Formosa sp. L2A11]|uniref:DUF6567 family protein n=1 Tax=Formosa sp. L2A11 TaxID=2686363 RepID=UPI001E29BC74|nr:DUF6567 family protein [Formosa sp. L2A11]